MTQSNAPSARQLAVEVYQEILRRKLPLEEAMSRHKQWAALSDQNQTFVHNLLASTFRHRGQFQQMLKPLLRKPAPAGVQALLELGMAQLLVLNIPPFAAVNSMVDVCKARGKTRPFAGLVNGVLRNVDRQREEMLPQMDEGRHAVPDWLWQSWERNYGKPNARHIALANLQRSPLDISVKDEAERATWQVELQAALLPTGSLRLPEEHDPIPTLPGFAAGAWWVQNASAALPAKLFGDVAGKLIFDLCAAPGGKTAQLASLGARVVAVDSSEERLERLRENMQRLGLTVETVVADVARWQPAELADAVLLDAPCSATGTIRRHPELPWIRDEAAVQNAVKTQRRLLTAASKLLKPGGELVYAVCSLQQSESEAQMAWFLEQDSDFQRCPLVAEALGLQADMLTAEGELRLLPQHFQDVGGMDGFFAAKLQKVV